MPVERARRRTEPACDLDDCRLTLSQRRLRDVNVATIECQLATRPSATCLGGRKTSSRALANDRALEHRPIGEDLKHRSAARDRGVDRLGWCRPPPFSLSVRRQVWRRACRALTTSVCDAYDNPGLAALRPCRSIVGEGTIAGTFSHSHHRNTSGAPMLHHSWSVGRHLGLVLGSIAGAATAIASLPVAAQESWPSRRVTVVVPFAAGSQHRCTRPLLAEHCGTF